MRHLRMQSKGQNLLELQNFGLKSAKIAPLFITNLTEFKKDSKAILGEIQRFFNGKSVIIRSSSNSEDSIESSNAGAFLSIANVYSSDTNALQKAILAVADSMPSPMDCILIQEMLENIALCGVAFSVDKDNLSPYFCVQYDTSGSHDSITSGTSNEIKSYFEYRDTPLEILQNLDSKGLEYAQMRQVINLIKELESIYGSAFLDIEFAFVYEDSMNNSVMLSFCEAKAKHLKGHKENIESTNAKKDASQTLRMTNNSHNLDSKKESRHTERSEVSNLESANNSVMPSLSQEKAKHLKGHKENIESTNTKKDASHTLSMTSVCRHTEPQRKQGEVSNLDSIESANIESANNSVMPSLSQEKAKHLDSKNTESANTKKDASTLRTQSLSMTSVCRHDLLERSEVSKTMQNQNTEPKLYLLQVRPIVTKNKPNLYDALPQDSLNRLYKRFNSLQDKRPHIVGRRAIFGVMPDWNPAEIIGIRPKRLAFSLYKEIITDSIWAYQRDNYGYRDLRSHPLMHSFLGIPYIDVRLSFNSFVPKKLDSKIAEKLVDYYISRLANEPKLHDKVEFEIVLSCYDLNAAKKLANLRNFGFNDNEIKRLEFSLLDLTNNILNEQNGLYQRDINKISRLKQTYHSLLHSNLSLFDKIYWLLEECKRYGTLPFAGVARAAFVAMALLNSLVEIGFLSLSEKAAFLNSLHTISKKLAFKSAKLKEMSDSVLSEAKHLKDSIESKKAEFLKEFGHLRAGSYSILSPRYDEDFSGYFENLDSKNNSVMLSLYEVKAKHLKNKKADSKKSTQITESKPHFKLSKSRLKKLDNLLIENGLQISATGLFKFFKIAIEGREYAKFEFSKLLSYSIFLIDKLGANYDICKEDMAHLDIQDIKMLYANLYSQRPNIRFLEQIRANKREYNLTLALKLPPLLSQKEQIFAFFSQGNSANFITQKSIQAKIALESSRDLQGKIVLIKSADPGYDYIFTKNIAGFITCYGGANSHMAIRASELGLPAVIGVGEEAFKRYLNASRLRIDCANEQVIIM